jgi:hypothetical protein
LATTGANCHGNRVVIEEDAQIRSAATDKPLCRTQISMVRMGELNAKENDWLAFPFWYKREDNHWVSRIFNLSSVRKHWWI